MEIKNNNEYKNNSDNSLKYKQKNNLLVDMLGMVVNPKAAWLSKILSITSIIYLILPIDIVPDVVPIVGFLDDLGVFILAIKVFFEQLKKYRNTKIYRE